MVPSHFFASRFEFESVADPAALCAGRWGELFFLWRYFFGPVTEFAKLKRFDDEVRSNDFKFFLSFSAPSRRDC